MSKYIHRNNIMITDCTVEEHGMLDVTTEVSFWEASVDCAMIEQVGNTHKTVENIAITRTAPTMEGAITELEKALNIAGVGIRG